MGDACAGDGGALCMMAWLDLGLMLQPHPAGAAVVSVAKPAGGNGLFAVRNRVIVCCVKGWAAASAAVPL